MMRVEAKLHRRRALQLWMLSMTMSAAINAHALGLGEIQVKSFLGEPFKARVNLSELSYADAHDLRVRLASIEEYQNIGSQYPDGIRFNFQFVNEQGKQPFIDIFTLRSVDEPFLTLLMEVSSASGKIIRDYTFLIDPAPGSVVTPVADQSAANAQQHAETKGGAAGNEVASGTEEARHAINEKPVARGAKRKKRKSGGASSVSAGSLLRTDSETSSDAAGKQRRRSPGKLALSLSTSLSISRDAPSQPGNPVTSRDALQEELIAKEKTVSELNAQIAEMQAVIKTLQIKLGIRAGSAVADSGVLAQGTAASSILDAAMSGTETGKPKVTVPAVTAQVAKPEKSSGSPDRFWSRVTGVIALLLLVAGAVLWYRKHKLEKMRVHGTFDELSESDNAVVQEESVGADKKAGEQSLKTPGYKELRTVSISSPDYDLLEQAEIYLRFGHDKLAEDVLHEAIRINPINPHGYLTLLGIYETREDAGSFCALAQQFKAIGDVADWKKVAEMGRKLDPGNLLYA